MHAAHATGGVLNRNRFFAARGSGPTATPALARGWAANRARCVAWPGRCPEARWRDRSVASPCSIALQHLVAAFRRRLFCTGISVGQATQAFCTCRVRRPKTHSAGAHAPRTTAAGLPADQQARPRCSCRAPRLRRKDPRVNFFALGTLSCCAGCVAAGFLRSSVHCQCCGRRHKLRSLLCSRRHARPRSGLPAAARTRLYLGWCGPGHRNGSTSSSCALASFRAKRPVSQLSRACFSDADISS